MLRSEFEQHPIWTELDTVDGLLDTIAGDHEPSEISQIELIRMLVSHVRTFRALSTTSPLLFANSMLDAVQNVFASVAASLDTRIASGVVGGPYMEQAVSYAESSLHVLAPWPRPYAKGAQIQATTTMYEDLLEAQRKSVEVLEAAHAKLLAEVKALTESTHSDQSALGGMLTRILEEARAAVLTVDNEKARIDAVVNDGLEMIARLEKEDTDRYKKWQADREKAFEKDFLALRNSMESQSLEATVILEELKATQQQYANLSTLAAGDLIAGEFKSEARWGRTAGLVAYGVGFLFIAAGAIPLLFLLAENPDTKSGAPDWGRIIVRVALAVLAGSAATVVIRLGARFVRNANLSKRMDLELRSFGPFLANVRDEDAVDTARIELLDRAFGKAYGAPEADEGEEVVQVSTVMQIIDAASKLIK